MNLKKFKGQYFGPLQIKTVVVLKDNTYFGKKRLKLIYTNDETEELPLEVVEQVVTLQPIDLSELRERRIIPFVQNLLGIVLESELGNDDLHYGLDLKLSETIRETRDRCDEKIFGKPKEKISLMDLTKILNNDENRDSKAASKRSEINKKVEK